MPRRPDPDQALGPTEPEYFTPVAWGVTVASLALLLLAPVWLDHDAWYRVVHDETGAMELLTVAFLLPVVVIGVLLAWRGRRLPKLTRGWFALLALGAFYFMGEEASWGQHILGFEPPAAVADKNLQGEFNIHNADAWYHDLFNEIPRTVAGACCIVGAGVLPWLVRDKRRDPDAPRRSWFWMIPTVALVVPGVVAFTINLPEKLIEDAAFAQEGRWAHYAFVAAADEAKEYFIALAMLLYAGSAFLRHRAWGRTGAAGDTDAEPISTDRATPTLASRA